jgi:hypothetical protein
MIKIYLVRVSFADESAASTAETEDFLVTALTINVSIAYLPPP